MPDLFVTELRYAFRVLRRRPSLTATAVTTIALAIAGVSTIVGIIDALYFRVPAQVRASEQIVRVYFTQDDPSGVASISDVGSYGQYRALRDNVRAFSSLAAVVSRPLSLGLGTAAQEVSASIVSASYFPLLGVSAAFGRVFTDAEDRERSHVAVISHALWLTRFGRDSAVIGRTIDVGRSTYTVIGITPAGFTGIGLEPTALWLPLNTAASEAGYSLQCTGCYWLGMVGRLGPAVTLARAAAEGTSSLRGTKSDGTAATGVVLGAIQEARGPSASQEARVSMWIGAAAFLLLLIACGNVACLLLARALERDREMAVRLALGSPRLALGRQLLLEGLLLALGGGAAGLLLSFQIAPLLGRYLLPAGAEVELVEPRILGFTTSLVLVTTILISVAPVLRVARTDLQLVLNTADRGRTARRSTERAALLVGQVAVALTLLVASGLFVRSFLNVTALPLGFEPDHLVAATADLQTLGYSKADIDLLYGRMQERVTRLSGVTQAALAIGSPFRVSMAIPIDVPGSPDSLLVGRMGAAYFQAVTTGYFQTLGTRVLRGRGFEAGDVRGAPLVAVVNRTMGRWVWQGEDPLGKCIKLSVGACRTIVGVVDDVRRNSLVESPTMQYYVPLAQADSLVQLPVTALLVRTAGSPEAMIQPLRRAIQGVSPTLPFVDVVSSKDLFDWQLRPRRLAALVVSLFGALAAILAAVGLYGALVYAVTRRTRELGIRMALGAPRWSLVGLVVREGLWITIAGAALGVIGGLVLGRLVSSQLYAVAPDDSAVLLGSAGLLLIVAFVASFAPARRATRVDPLGILAGD
jgi:putative ABC transport system permease protein